MMGIMLRWLCVAGVQSIRPHSTKLSVQRLKNPVKGLAVASDTLSPVALRYLGDNSTVLSLSVLKRRIFAASANGVVRGPQGFEYKHSSAVWSTLPLQNSLAIGDARGGVHFVDATNATVSSSWPRRLSGWVRAMCIHNNEVYAIGCNEIFSTTSSLDSGPTTECEEPWRRHDILCLVSTHTFVYAGLVDGSLRRWSCAKTIDRRVAHAHAGRVIALLLSAQGQLISVGRDGLVKRWDAELHEQITTFDAKAPISCASSAHGYVVFASNTTLFILEDNSLQLRCTSLLERRVSSLLASTEHPSLPLSDNHDDDSAASLYVVAGFTDGYLALYRYYTSSYAPYRAALN